MQNSFAQDLLIQVFQVLVDPRTYAVIAAPFLLWILYLLIVNRKMAILDLPLLRKELTELAVRPRTYVIRILYACLLLTISWAAMENIARQAVGNNPYAIMGSGGRMFEMLLNFQTIGIVLLTPALACGTITSEKERNTLGLLFLTRLGLWGIILEKLLSRLIPVMTFLLLSMPLFAVAYSFGGVNTWYMFGAIFLLFTTAVLLAAISMMCSTYFRTTAGAFIWAYLLEVMLMFTCLIPIGMLFNSRFVSGLVLITACMMCWFITGGVLLMSRFFLTRRAFIQPKQRLLKLFKWIDGLFNNLNDRYTKGVVLVKEEVGLPEDDPIAWRETKKRSLGTVRYLFRVFVAIEVPLLFFCLMLTIETRYGSSYALSGALLVVWFIACLVITVQSAGLVAAERTHETLNVLLTTHLTSREIIEQKFAGVRRTTNVLRVPLLTIFLFSMYLFGGFYRSWVTGFYPNSYALCFLLALVIYPMLIGWLGVLVSLYVKSHSRATLMTLGILVAWCLGPFFVWRLFSSYNIQPGANAAVALQIVMVGIMLAFIAMMIFAITRSSGKHSGLFSQLIRGLPKPYLIAGIVLFMGLVFLPVNKRMNILSPAYILITNEVRNPVWVERAQRIDPMQLERDEQSARILMTLVNFACYGTIAFGLRAMCFRLAGPQLGRNEGQAKYMRHDSSGQNERPSRNPGSLATEVPA